MQVESLKNAPRDMPRIRVTFQYDGQSRRIRKTVEQFERGNRTTPVSDTTFLYDGWNMIQESTVCGLQSAVSSYVWGLDLSGTPQGAGGIGGLISMSTVCSLQSAVYSPSFDANGNVMSYHDNDGTTVAAYEYDPFGRTIEAHGPMASEFPYRFSTKYTDDETGLVYYGYRFYKPDLGRWLNRDPIGEVGGLNLYVFIKNSSLYHIDYLGLWNIEPSDPIGIDIPAFEDPPDHENISNGCFCQDIVREGKPRIKTISGFDSRTKKCECTDSIVQFRFWSINASYRLGRWQDGGKGLCPADMVGEPCDHFMNYVPGTFVVTRDWFPDC